MADKKSATNKHQWPNGSWHSIPWAQQVQRLQAQAAADARKQGGGTGQQIMAAGAAYYKAMGIPNPNAPGGDSDPNRPGAGGPGVLPQPFDPSFEAQKQSATWNIQLGDADANYQRGQTAYNTGYNADGTRNTANPYAQAQLLQENWQRSKMGADNSLAAAGQFFSGARANAQARNDRLYAVDSDSLRRSAGDTYYGIGRGQLGTYASNTLGVTGGAYESLRKSVYGS